MITPDSIKQLAQKYFPDVKAARRELHAHPELSFQENNTASFIEQKLKEAGIESRRVAKTGIVALINSGPGGKAVALRADLDALPIEEKNEVSYKSQNPGVMHACGHDVHTSSLLGAAMILKELENQLPHPVKLVFQPGEEKLPGGASLILKEGALENPAQAAIFGQHVTNELEAGTVGFCPGMYMASADEIYVRVKGKGGHAAMPQNNIDPILIASNLIVALQQVVSRWNKPGLPSVLSFGKIEGLGATNVIPDEVYLEGTFRTFNEEWRFEAHKRMKALAKGLVEGMGGTVDFDIRVGYPFLKNDEALTEKAMQAANGFLGKKNVFALDIRTTSEDFAYYSQKMPACFYRLGTGNKKKGITAPIHSSHFDIDEEALKTGVGLMAYLGCLEV